MLLLSELRSPFGIFAACITCALETPVIADMRLPAALVGVGAAFGSQFSLFLSEWGEGKFMAMRFISTKLTVTSREL